MSAPELRLAVDANALVGGVFSETGIAMLTHPGLRLVIAKYVLGEVHKHLPHRVTGMVRTAQTAAAVALTEIVALPAPLTSYQQFETEARERLRHDQDDWHTVALALAFGIAIWTNDRHYFGCGVAVWSTDTLRRRIAAGRI